MSDRTTGLQTAHGGLVAMLRAFERQLSPREYAVLVDLLRRYLDAERQRNERTHKRWVA